jgi:hypothetical protein
MGFGGFWIFKQKQILGACEHFVSELYVIAANSLEIGFDQVHDVFANSFEAFHYREPLRELVRGVLLLVNVDGFVWHFAFGILLFGFGPRGPGLPIGLLVYRSCAFICNWLL